MSSPTTPVANDPAKGNRLLFGLGWVVALVLLAYFIHKNIPRYLHFTAESYGGHFWPLAHFLVPHIAGGLLAALIGPVQFWPKMRRDYLGAHRIAGRVYLVGVLVGALASWGMAVHLMDDPAYGTGLFALGVAWIATTAMAFVAIKRGNLVQHKQWMVRSYVVTFAFVSFRLVDDSLDALQVWDGDKRGAMLAWACWAVPLLVTELVIQGGAVFRARR